MFFRKIYLFLFLTSIFFNSLASQVEGCSDGDYIFLNPTGEYFQDNPPSSPYVYYYYQTNPVYIQRWGADPVCGIKFGRFNNATHGRCKIIKNGSPVEGAGLVYFDSDDVTCAEDLPLDDYIPLLLLLAGLIGFYFLRKQIILPSA